MFIETFKRLEWDSQFLGYPVARFSIDNECNDKLDELFLQIEAERFKLKYFFVHLKKKNQ